MYCFLFGFYIVEYWLKELSLIHLKKQKYKFSFQIFM